MLGKENVEIVAQKFVHRLVDKRICDSFLSLVFVGSYRRKAIGNKHKTVGNIRKGDLRLILCVLAVIFEIFIKREGKCALYRSVGGAAVFKEASAVVVFKS